MDPRSIAPRHICVLLHGVETAAGEISWAERMEVLCQNSTRTPIEFVARSYGGLLLNKTSALATLVWPPYRRKIVDREEEFFKLLYAQEGRKRISVIAHSFGGYVVCELLKRGHVFHRIVLVAPAAPEGLDWHRFEDQFGLVFIYWSPVDEVLPWAYYGKMGYTGPQVKHGRVFPIRRAIKHSGYLTPGSHFDYFSRHWIAALEDS